MFCARYSLTSSGKLIPRLPNRGRKKRKAREAVPCCNIAPTTTPSLPLFLRNFQKLPITDPLSPILNCYSMLNGPIFPHPTNQWLRLFRVNRRLRKNYDFTCFFPLMLFPFIPYSTKSLFGGPRELDRKLFRVW